MGHRSPELAATAVEAGVAANAAGRPARASTRFRSALRHLDDAGPGASAGTPMIDRLRARALLGLVMSDFELRADVERCLETLDTAEKAAVAAAAHEVRVAILGQRGLLWLRAGEPWRARTALDAAVSILDRAEPRDACRVLLNRGSLALDQGRLADARRDLAECAARADAVGERGLAFKARHNLGYAEFLAGDLPRALSTMAAAARETGGVSLGVAHLDRAQVLLEAGLVTEADATLAAAAELFREQRLAFDLAQVELARSRCAVLLGKPSEALRFARSAHRSLVRRGNLPWAARAASAELRARLELAKDAPVPGRAALLRLAGDAEVQASAATSSRELAASLRAVRAEALVAAGRHAEAAAAAGRLTGSEPLGVAVALRAVKAELAFAAGRPGAARRHVAAGQALLAAQRRQLGSVEAVTAAAVHGVALTRVAVADALRRRDAPALLAAVESGRATFAGPARVRPPADDRLADLLAELRVAAERERLLPPDAPADERARCRQETARVRTAARERAWELGEGTEAPQAVPLAQVLEALTDGAAAADHVVHSGLVHAVLVRSDGVSLRTLAPAAEIETLLRRVEADLLALARPVLPAPLREVVHGSLARGLRRLDELLMAPLDHDGPLHVVAGSGLVTLPWGMLPSRAGRPTSVATRLAVDGATGRRPGAVAVAGPDLALASSEAVAVADAWSGVVLAGPAATAGAAADALRTAGVVHLAAHGRHEPENPLFSWVRLADGPLFAHELEGADLAGSLVVLSSCEVGRATVRAGGEVLGMASVLLRLGAATVVAALAPIRDDLAACVMPELHSRPAAGAPAATALAEVLAEAGEPVPIACFSAAVPLT